MTPKYITIHASATRPKHSFDVHRLRELHVNQNGWNSIGYHFYVTTDGVTHPCRPLNQTGAHVKGHNRNNIGICLEGGLDNDTGKPSDTFNDLQWDALRFLLTELQGNYGIKDVNVKGHRDWGANKACPCFDVKTKLEEWKK